MKENLHWERYVAMCGEIDEEITVPNSLKRGSLCPHQDYVYLFPNLKEEEETTRSVFTEEEGIREKSISDSCFEAVRTSH